jgi:L-arabinose isomerase
MDKRSLKKKQKFESYQVSESTSHRDIISRQKTKALPRVGLLTMGYFEYWRMYDGLAGEVRQLMQRIADHMKQSRNYELVYPGFVDDYPKAEKAAKAFADKQVDLLVFVEGTYFPDYIPFYIKRQLDHVPILIYSPQSFRHVSPKLGYRDILRDSGLVGLIQLTGAFAKVGWDYEVLTGPIDDKEIYRQIEIYAQVIGCAKALKSLKVGMYGHPFRGMFDIELDTTKLAGALGPECIYIEHSHLQKALQNAEAKEQKKIKSLIRECKRRWKIENLDDDALYRGCRMAVALENLVRQFNLDVLSLLSQYNLQYHFHDTAGFASSRLLDLGTMVSCEGDVATLIMMYALYYFSGRPPYYGEYTVYDLDLNAFLFSHHGDGSPTLARSQKPQDIRLTNCPESWGCSDYMMAFEFIMRQGRVTLAGLIDDKQGQKMLVAGGESLDHPPFPVHSPHVLCRPDIPVKDFLSSIMKSGFRHHAVIALGDYREHMQKLAKFLNIRCLAL